MDGPFRTAGADLLVCVRLTPRAGRDGFDGLKTLADGRRVVAARVRAVPEDGRANAALELLLAAAAGLPKSAAAVVGGGAARLKTVRLAGGAASVDRLRDVLGG